MPIGALRPGGTQEVLDTKRFGLGEPGCFVLVNFLRTLVRLQLVGDVRSPVGLREDDVGHGELLVLPPYVMGGGIGL